MKRVKQILLGLLIIIIVLIGGVTIYSIYSPVPMSWLTKYVFDKTVYEKPNDYDNYLQAVNIKRDIKYSDEYQNSYLDIITNKGSDQKTPIIFWVHGGAFVAGDKKDSEAFSVMLASKGFAVVNINYGLAPQNKYPTQIKQIIEAYKFIKNNEKDYNFDLSQAFFAGDSVGGLMISQFLIAQTNTIYANKTKIAQVVDRNTIKGALLYATPYNFGEMKLPGGLANFIYEKIGWGYFGNQNFKNSEEFDYSNVYKYIDPNFPSSFVVDGNTGTFTEQAKKFIRVITSKKIKNDSLFFDKEEVSLEHEFQFKLNTKEALEVVDKTTEFLFNQIKKAD